MSEAQQHRLALPQGTRIRDFEFYRVLLGYWLLDILSGV